MAAIDHIEDLFGVVRRRRSLMLGVALPAALAGLLAAGLQTPVYEASAMIQVELPTVDLATGPGTAGPDSMLALLQSIEQRLTTRNALADMADRHGLFQTDPPLSTEQKARALRDAITVLSLSRDGAPDGTGVSAIRVTARAPEAELAARVANDLAQGIVDEGQARQVRSTRATLAFFAAEEARLWAALNAVERQISTYRAQNADALPEEAPSRRNILLSLAAERRALDQTFLALKSERDSLATAADPDDAAASATRVALDSRLGQVARLRAAVDAQRARLEAALARIPEVEGQLNGLSRSLDALQDQYATVNARLAEAQAAQRMAEHNQSEHLTILERAITPVTPTGAGPLVLALVTTLGAALLGLAAAIWADLRHPVVRTARQMDREFGILPVVSIPELSLRPPAAGFPDRVQGAMAQSGQIAAQLRESPVALGSAAVVVALISALF